MYVFNIEDPNQGLGNVIRALREEGLRQDSRNGPVVRFPRPVCLHYPDPRRRVLSSPVRDANPVFHLVETIWMFAGMAELEPLLLYNAGMAQYSDDGKNLRGTAYGHRWRSYGWGDQIFKAAQALRQNPDDRRVVITMWDPLELGEQGKDFACNLQIIFNTRPACGAGGNPVLDMTVTNRSNDLIYGAMGSNMFHFSMLLEYMALLTGLEVGSYYQVSSNLHLYTENPTAARCWEEYESLQSDEISSMSDNTLTMMGLSEDPRPIRAYVQNRDHRSSEPYIASVVVPLVEAYHIFKMKTRTGMVLPTQERIGMACGLASACASRPLGRAAEAWFKRRQK